MQDKEPFPDHSDIQLYSIWSHLYLLAITTQKVITSGFTIELLVKSHTSSSSCSVMSNSLWPHGLPGSSVHGILQARILVKSATATAKSLQSYPTLWPHRWQPTRLPHPWDSPGKNTGVDAISFSNAWKWKVRVKSLSRVRLLATPWTAAHQAPPSMGFSSQEYWSGVPLSSPTGQV